ncbi:MAG: CCA tRNA nucleotidyltransferase [Oscillospiraceae bacterium]|jgi:tRNA nucleotidyltransferase (CCA-adding enzyme)|nr:CCA tRNA nucleotidyltransferase [Oscillospiraceae bacterium]
MLKLPQNAKKIIETLNTAGYECYAVGGCVRDMLCGEQPHDWDFTTNARPEETLKVFADYKTYSIGRQHGTIGVQLNKTIYEITTYRIDGEYDDNRHPTQVEFTTDLQTDLARRDFTVNAMACDGKAVMDFFDGKTDLEYKVIRAVGDPKLRFEEDALRILRALRFASTKGFTIEPTTERAIFACAGLLNNLAVERVADELIKILCGNNAEQVLRRYKSIFAVIIPELAAMFDYDQHTPHHNRNLWSHTVAALKNIENSPLLRVVMLLHDIGKPIVCTTDSDGICHFYGHQKVSAQMAQVILTRLKFPNKFVANAVTLIELHDIRFNGNARSIKKVLQTISPEQFRELLQVQKADMLAQSECFRAEKLNALKATKDEFLRIESENQCVRLKDLAINGGDLLAMGITDGRTIGKILDTILDEVVADTLQNEKGVLTKRAAEIKNGFELND